MALQPFSNNSQKQRSLTHANKNHGPHRSDNQLVNRHGGGGTSGNDIFGQMMARHEHMANQMMGDFGGGMLKNFRDPFANDPFFQEPFGQMDKMISQMRSDMKRRWGPERQMAEPMQNLGSHSGSGSGKGRFAQMQTITSTQMDANGNPVKQTYQNKSQGAFGGGNRVTERHQMYANGGNGYQKMAHERMMNNQGRKVVRERLGGNGGPTHSNDLFKNIRRENSDAFDQEWDAMAQHLGFNYSNNRLGYGGNSSNSHGSDGFGGRGTQAARQAAYGIDDGRRGHYVPAQTRAINAPVQLNSNGRAQNQRREIEPTIPGGNIHAPGAGRQAQQNSNQRAAGPLPLPSSNDYQQAPAARRAGPTQANTQAARVHRVPRQTTNKPAKAG